MQLQTNELLSAHGTSTINYHNNIFKMAMKRMMNDSDESSWPSSQPFMKHAKRSREQTSPPQCENDKSSRYTVSQLAHIKPISFVKSCFRAYGINAEQMNGKLYDNYFLKTTEEHIAAYESDIIDAIRNEDIEYLRAVKRDGRSLQGSNRFGESIVHLACRRGSVQLLKFLVTEGDITLRVMDDYGRTPLHDACWKKEPNFEMIDAILDNEPELLLVADTRGHLPFDYARTHHWGLWIKYLEGRMKKEIKNRLSNSK